MALIRLPHPFLTLGSCLSFSFGFLDELSCFSGDGNSVCSGCSLSHSVSWVGEGGSGHFVSSREIVWKLTPSSMAAGTRAGRGTSTSSLSCVVIGSRPQDDPTAECMALSYIQTCKEVMKKHHLDEIRTLATYLDYKRYFRLSPSCSNRTCFQACRPVHETQDNMP